MDHFSRKFAEFACGLRFEDLSHQVVLHAKKTILDLIGVVLAGYPMEFPTMVIDYIAGLGGETRGHHNPEKREVSYHQCGSRQWDLHYRY